MVIAVLIMDFEDSLENGGRSIREIKLRRNLGNYKYANS